MMTKINKATPASKANKSMGNSSNKSLKAGFLSKCSLLIHSFIAS